MAGANFPNFERAARAMAAYQAKQTQLNLQATHTRVAIRATWKKVGKSWSPTGHRIQRFRANYVATGTLVNSIQPYYNSPSDFGITTAWYAEAIRRGRQPMGGMKGGKGIPIDTMKTWTETRRIKPKDPSNGQFVPPTERNKKSMRYLMNRKIKFFGIQGWDFINFVLDYVKPEWNPKLEAALGEDINQLILSKSKKGS